MGELVLQGSAASSWIFGYTADSDVTGSNWAAVSLGTMMRSNTAPVITVTGSATIQRSSVNGYAAWVQGTALPFAVSDIDGDAPQRYRFTDVGAGATTSRIWTLSQSCAPSS